MNERIVIIGSDEASVGYLYHVLGPHVVGVIVEKSVGKLQIVQRRFKRYGIIATIGQVLFVVCLLPLIRLISHRRITELAEAHHISAEALVPEILHHVPSVNSKETLALLELLKPSTIVVYGTRLIKAGLLSRIHASWINIHAGITPWYRGGHGAYWAFAEGKPERAGVTVHAIDAGIDTGSILAQGTITATAKDTIVTYPLLQLVEGARLVQEILNGTPPPSSVPLSADRLYTHPTIWEYVVNLVTHGVK